MDPQPKMMPGQEPYTAEEWKTVMRLVAIAARANLTEEEEEDLYRAKLLSRGDQKCQRKD